MASSSSDAGSLLLSCQHELKECNSHNQQLMSEEHKLRSRLATCEDELEKCRFEIGLVNEQREHLAANMDRARADLKGAQAQFAKDIKGAQEMAGLAIVEKERALADMQLAQVFR